jgi:hypothetical protein
MEYEELQQRIDEIHDKLLAARDSVQVGLDLINKLELELLRERATRSNE